MAPKHKKRIAIFSVIILLLGSGAWYGYTHTLGIVDALRDMRLGMAGFSEQVIRTDSAEVHYYRGGKGKKTVLFIHGFGLGGATTWFDTMLSLDEDVNLIVPDLVWFGNSQGQMKPTLPNQARTMWALCDQLNITPDAIVGVSYGGFVAFEMLNQRPEGAKELLIINSPGPIFQKDDIRQMCERAEVNTPDELFVPKDEQGLRHLFSFVFAEEPPIPDFIYHQIFEKETLKNADTKRVLMRDLVDNADTYRRGRLPTHTKNNVVWGRHDRVFPLTYGQKLADTLHAEITVLEESGHVPNPDEREVYLALLKKILVN